MQTDSTLMPGVELSHHPNLKWLLGARVSLWPSYFSFKHMTLHLTQLLPDLKQGSVSLRQAPEITIKEHVQFKKK